jgi:hypothetical protein
VTSTFTLIDAARRGEILGKVQNHLGMRSVPQVHNDDQIVFGWGEIAPEVFKSLLNSDVGSGYREPL